MIELIKIKELGSALEIFKDVTSDMINKGINQWDSIYPDKEILEKDINNHYAYGYYIKDELIGYISINDYYDKEYDAINWLYTDNKALIIHRLAIKSKAQGLGIAKRMMQFAENRAKLDGYKTIRLDAYSKNPYALALYQSLGYKYSGDVKLRKGLFCCFEKKINE